MIADAHEDIISKACRHVRSQPHFREIEVKLDFEQVDDVLIVRGQVPTFFLKQVLQRALADLDGIARIENFVEVTYGRIHSLATRAKRPFATGTRHLRENTR